MQFTAVFVAYLVTGVVALFWILPITSRVIGIMPQLDEAKILLAVPLLIRVYARSREADQFTLA